jgi:hypothetical protein
LFSSIDTKLIDTASEEDCGFWGAIVVIEVIVTVVVLIRTVVKVSVVVSVIITILVIGS